MTVKVTLLLLAGLALNRNTHGKKVGGGKREGELRPNGEREREIPKLRGIFYLWGKTQK